jgi:hypothetical protein
MQGTARTVAASNARLAAAQFTRRPLVTANVPPVNFSISRSGLFG